MSVLVTGAAGFIGMHVCVRLLAEGHEVIGLDNLNDYYEVSLKEARLAQLQNQRGFTFPQLDLANDAGIAALFSETPPTHVIHLGAQAGVRYSLTHPHTYVDSNVRGTVNILEGCRAQKVEHLVFASTSSVYGLNARMPFSTHRGVDHPVSLYASTKRAGELMGHNYAHLFQLPVTALRFFTVYGPWGRPDMSPMLFARKILAGEPIDVFNYGQHQRDFTYVDDIVEGVVRACFKPATSNAHFDREAPDPASSSAPFRIYNIGYHEPVPLLRFIELLEQALGRQALRNLLPMQAGDVEATYAEIADLETEVGYRPRVSIEEGVQRFVAWYRDYYRV